MEKAKLKTSKQTFNSNKNVGVFKTKVFKVQDLKESFTGGFWERLIGAFKIAIESGFACDR